MRSYGRVALILRLLPSRNTLYFITCHLGWIPRRGSMAARVIHELFHRTSIPYCPVDQTGMAGIFEYVAELLKLA